MQIKKPIEISRLRGAFLGLAIGDALGTTHEFKPRDTYRHLTDIVGGGPFKLKAGEWTDDTSMALCLAQSLLQNDGFDPANVMNRFVNWRDHGINSVTGICFDIGNVTFGALGRYLSDGNPYAGNPHPNTAGNGSVMRLAPVPVFYAYDAALARDVSMQQSRLTHAAPEAVDGCAWLSDMLTGLFNSRALDDFAPDPAWSRKIAAITPAAVRAIPRERIKSRGYVVDTLEAALWAVVTTDNFRDALLRAVNLGGDADTIGAVTGQIAGALYGESGIPQDWLKKLAWREQLADTAQKLAEHGLNPRPTSAPANCPT